MKDRIRQIMEAQHMSQQVFANAIGTTPATLSGIFNDRTRPTINIIESIKRTFPDISLEWLMFGDGEMYGSKIRGAEAQEAGGQGDDLSLKFVQDGQQQIFDFGAAPAPTTSSPRLAAQNFNGVRNTRQEIVREEVKKVDKTPRHVTEIRVYYDDQTWESFVPAKK